MAEAAFQDKVWRPRLTPLRAIARLRIVHCVVDADVAFQRILRRRAGSNVRLAHADPGPALCLQTNRARSSASWGMF